MESSVDATVDVSGIVSASVFNCKLAEWVLISVTFRWKAVQAAAAAQQHHQETACEGEGERLQDHQTAEENQGAGWGAQAAAAGQTVGLLLLLKILM